MPKDPLLQKVEKLKDRANIYAEELYTQDYEPLSAVLADEDRVFLQSYGHAAFADLTAEDERLGVDTDVYGK